MRRAAPRPLALAVTALSQRVAPRTALAEIQSCWPEIVGSLVAEQGRPEGERGGVLTVTCSSAVWASELNLMAPAVIAKINSALGRTAVLELRCRTRSRDPAASPGT